MKMDILLAEGIGYFQWHLQKAGAFKSDSSDFWAFHSTESWENVVNSFENLSCRHTVNGFDLIKTTEMKNGMKNYVFLIIY